MREHNGWGLLACAALVLMVLTGCSRTPESLAGTSWKVTQLKAPDGTEYDEAAYDMIIGATVYRFAENGSMACQIGDAPEDTSTYRYTYADGELNISSAEMSCAGKVKPHEIRLQLGEEGFAVLTEQNGE